MWHRFFFWHTQISKLCLVDWLHCLAPLSYFLLVVPHFAVLEQSRLKHLLRCIPVLRVRAGLKIGPIFWLPKHFYFYSQDKPCCQQWWPYRINKIFSLETYLIILHIQYKYISSILLCKVKFTNNLKNIYWLPQ